MTMFQSSNAAVDLETSDVLVTEPQARARGIPIKREPPKPDICEFCGSKLYRKGIVFSGAVMFWQPFPTRCGCDKSIEKWFSYDHAEKQKEIAKDLENQRRTKQAKMERLLGKSGIKKRFQQRTFSGFIADTADRKASYRIAKEYADNFENHCEKGEGLYIEGTNGTGKTHLAAAIALQLINEREKLVICKTSNDILLDIKKTFDSREISESDVLCVYKTADLLIIDDLGKETCSDWSMSMLYAILNDRYEDMKPTIITTNYSSEELARALTPKGFDGKKAAAIISRLRETSSVITMAWKDYRQCG